MLNRADANPAEIGSQPTLRHLPALDIDSTDKDYPPIDDYAIIGDCCTSALIAISGAIEWMCLPNVSSPSCFAAILDRSKGGSFALRPTEACEVRRRYLPDTAVLETTFDTATGQVRVTDFMSISDGEHPWRANLRPQRELIRIIEGIDGYVELTAIVDPRPDYGRRRASFSERRGFGWVSPGPGSLFVIRTDLETRRDQGGARLIGTATLHAGESRTVSMSYTEHEIALQPPLGSTARRQLDVAKEWWCSWSARCVFEGPRRPLVVRSAITLKLLTYALSGAVVAAATTSLPEAVGADRTWDYRFCWLRDASTAMQAFLGLGLQEEADAFMGWMLNATRLTRPELRILYDLHGRNDATEEELDHLDGYKGSRPVRIGNAAGSQLQLDSYGWVIMSAYEYVERMGTLRGGEMRLLRDFGKVVCRRWQEPDQGLWEVRGKPRHFTATKLMCWVALDRLIRLAEGGRVRIPIERFRANRAAIARAIELRGYSERLEAYVAELDSGAHGVPDAAVLVMGAVGFADPLSNRLAGTLSWITDELGRDGLYARYPTGFDGVPSREGAFGICLAWAIGVMIGRQDVDGAIQALDRFAETANDLGLFAEEYDTEEKTSLGNFPQAFTHAGYITAALSVERAVEAGAR